jgi:hypothetical protein
MTRRVRLLHPPARPRRPPTLGLMAVGATTWLAIYGAVVATGTGGWNIYAYLHAHHVRLKIEGESVQFGPAVFNPGTNVAQGVRFRVRNRSSFPVEVVEVGFGKEGSGSMWSSTPEGMNDEVPVTIAPKDIADFHWKTVREFGDSGVITQLQSGTPFVLKLKDGKKVWAKPWQLSTQTKFEPVKRRRFRR